MTKRRGIASLVLDEPPRASARIGASARRGDAFAAGSLAGEAIGASAGPGAVFITLGFALSVALHGGALAAVGITDHASPERPAPAPPMRVERVVDLPPPEAAAPEPKAPEPPSQPTPPPEPASGPSAQEPPRAARRPSRSAPAESPAPAPARAGEVVTADAGSEVLDFTGFDIPSGDEGAHASGATSSSGRGPSGGEGPGGPGRSDAAGPRTQPAPEDRTKPVTLPAKNWSCPWPAEADNLGIDEQVVVLRVVVDATGTASRVELIADPGHGFGASARACARKARFDPARERDGRAYAATSPPIRVRFTRR